MLKHVIKDTNLQGKHINTCVTCVYKHKTVITKWGDCCFFEITYYKYMPKSLTFADIN